MTTNASPPPERADRLAARDVAEPDNDEPELDAELQDEADTAVRRSDHRSHHDGRHLGHHDPETEEDTASGGPAD